MYPNTGLANRKHPNTGGWQNRHDTAWGQIDVYVPGMTEPHGIERSVVAMLKGWELYAKMHKRRFGSAIGDDGFLGPQWLATGKALRALLNGETGRLDCGTVDAFILDTITANGFTEGDL